MQTPSTKLRICRNTRRMVIPYTIRLHYCGSGVPWMVQLSGPTVDVSVIVVNKCLSRGAYKQMGCFKGQQKSFINCSFNN